MAKIIPFGDRILVRRRKVGGKIGKEQLLIASDNTANQLTDIAEVMAVPDLTLGDKALLESAEQIITALCEKAKAGDSDAAKQAYWYAEFCKMKSIQAGDVVMISKYVGTDFSENDSTITLTLVRESDIIGLVAE